MAASAALPSTQLSASDFTLLDKIGEGSYGKVYKAVWKQYNALVAVKVIQLESDWLPLLAEVNMVIDLRHESIVNYYGWFFRERELWLIMEYCDGGSLSDVIKVLGHGLNEMQLSAIAHCVLSSLAYVHSLKRIHRDIKAGNLLVTSTGLVKLCDFGIAAQLDANVVQRGTRIGSPYWMAPEVISSVGHDTKADIWSFGITILELFSGVPPHWDLPLYNAMLAIQKGPPPKTPDGISNVFRAFLQKVLVKDPDSRPTAEELLMTPFILKSGDHSAQIIVDLFLRYRQHQEEKKFAVRPLEPAAPAGADDPELQTLTQEAVGTILYGGTFVRRDGTTVQADGTFVLGDGTFVRHDATSSGQGTFVRSEGTFVANSGTAVRQPASGDALAAWTMQFLDKPRAAQKVAQAQQRNFANFSERDLRYLLHSVKQLALSELAEGKPKATVVAHYEEVRVGIVDELRRLHPEIPRDFEAIP